MSTAETVPSHLRFTTRTVVVPLGRRGSGLEWGGLGRPRAQHGGSGRRAVSSPDRRRPRGRAVGSVRLTCRCNGAPATTQRRVPAGVRPCLRWGRASLGERERGQAGSDRQAAASTTCGSFGCSSPSCYGQLKNVSIPVEELEKALDNELMFDGSSIRGYKRIEQSDMYFHPDPTTFALLPWRERRSGAIGAAHLRRRRPRRHAVRRRSARRAEARRGGGQGARLHDARRARGGVLPLQARRRRQPDGRPARRGGVLRRRARRPRREHAPRHRGHARADGLPPRGVAPRGRDRPARDRLPPRGGARPAPTT